MQRTARVRALTGNTAIWLALWLHMIRAIAPMSVSAWHAALGILAPASVFLIIQ